MYSLLSRIHLNTAVPVRCAQHVIQVDKYKIIKHVSEDIIDHCLKNNWGVRKAKWQRLTLKMSQGGVESRLLFISLLNADQVICVS